VSAAALPVPAASYPAGAPRARREEPRSVVVGVQWWNVRPVSALLAVPAGAPVFARTTAAAIPIAAQLQARVVAWASRTGPEDEEACRAAGVALWRIEDGFIRSVGLGAGLAAGASYVLDARGIHYDARRPSDIEELLNTAELSDADRERGADLRRLIVATGISKYNVGRKPCAPAFPVRRERVLVPGQVGVDASIRQTLSATIDCSGALNPNLALLASARARRPKAFIVYKPHPDVAAGLRPGGIEESVALRYADRVVAGTDIIGLIEQCDSLETLSSLSGFEALLRGKHVVVHGLPFYAGWGLTQDLTAAPRRHRRRRRLDELVFLALVRYGRYVDPATVKPCAPERLIEQLAELRRRRWPLRRALLWQQVSWAARKAGL
jgi:capsular polysaccharide export protein